MARSSMAARIADVRSLISDPAGPSQHFSDDDIERALDGNRTDVRYEQLQPAITYLAGQPATVTEFYASAPYWEDDETLYNATYAVIVPSVSDTMVGKWTFATNQNLLVMLTGKRYDIYAAAADLLEQLLASLMLTAYDFADEGQSLRLSQQINNIRAVIAQYRSRASGLTIRQMRSDVAAGSSNRW